MKNKLSKEEKNYMCEVLTDLLEYKKIRFLELPYLRDCTPEQRKEVEEIDRQIEAIKKTINNL